MYVLKIYLISFLSKCGNEKDYYDNIYEGFPTTLYYCSSYYSIFYYIKVSALALII